MSRVTTVHVKCDRCGGQCMSTGNSVQNISYDFMAFNGRGIYLSYHKKDLDLCVRCTDEFMKFMYGDGREK